MHRFRSSHHYVLTGTLVIQLVLSVMDCHAQTLNFYGGINATQFFDYEKNEGHFAAKYQPGIGAAIGVGISHLPIDHRTHAFRVSLESYRGHLSQTYGSLGNTVQLEARTNKCNLNLEIYFITIVASSKTNLNLGAQWGFLLWDKNTGYQKSLTNPNQKVIDYENERLNRRMQAGIDLLLTHELQAHRSVFDAINMHFYYGLTSEFLMTSVPSFRLRIELSFNRPYRSFEG